MRVRSIALFASLALANTGTAKALCIYGGVDNARTSQAQEFADARWVVRARVVGADDGTVEAGNSDAGEPWTRYRQRVIHAFKHNSPGRFTFFTTRDSGGFYMDRRWAPLSRVHEIGRDYLLFLNPIPRRGRSTAARGAVFVNYNCGQSRPWSKVSSASRRWLTARSLQR
jgi:hypothetical protein